MTGKTLFDDWTEAYDRWFQTAIGKLVKRYETALVLAFLNPVENDRILDAGCGTGIFTTAVLASGARVWGVDISLPMLTVSAAKAGADAYFPAVSDILNLPFNDHVFDKVISVTALEFIADGTAALKELFRVTRPGGTVVVATLNRLSPWAERRKNEVRQKEDSVFRNAVFRSPDDIRKLMPIDCEIRTAVHFQKNSDPLDAERIERQHQQAGSENGAFLIARWKKPQNR